MRTFIPDYYKSFKCKAENCDHNCCIGWEIDIDENSYEFYKSIGGDFGAKLENGINHSNCPSFKLKENERCAFLNEKGLCEIIINLGENALCDICKLHPRYINEFENFTETGLGLACEEAARIITEKTTKTELIEISENKNALVLNDTEKAFLEQRQNVLNIITNRNLRLSERFSSLFSAKISPKETAIFYKSLERLDNTWDKFLDILENTDKFVLDENASIPLEQIAVYFIYRHLFGTLEDNLLKERLNFCLLSVLIISTIATNSNTKLAEICRLYSSEIEYSDENIDKILWELF